MAKEGEEVGVEEEGVFQASVVIENGVTRIGAFAFNYYTSLQDVTISNTVTSIGKCALIYNK